MSNVWACIDLRLLGTHDYDAVMRVCRDRPQDVMTGTNEVRILLDSPAHDEIAHVINLWRFPINSDSIFEVTP